MDDVVVSSAAIAPTELAAALPVDPRRARPAPKAVQCVLPVWGHRFVRQFLELSLPTLLAPGNVPTLAAKLPTQFIILTRFDDEDYIRHHPMFRRLCDVCPVE